MTVIDLDQVPVRAPARRRRWSGRRPAAAVVTVASALALCAAATSQAALVPPPVRIGLPYAQAFRVLDDAIYVFDGLGLSVHKYGLDGRRRWTARVPAVSFETFVPVGGRLLFRLGGTRAHTVALDPGTGAEVWRAEGSLTAVAGTVAVLATDEGDAATRYTGVAAADGRVRWEQETGDGAQLMYVPHAAGLVVDELSAPQVAGLVLTAPDGSSRFLDAATGETRPSPIRISFDTGYVLAAAGLLLVTDAGGIEGGQNRVTALDPGDARRWEAPLHSEGWVIRPCGPYLCLPGPAGMVAVDPADGSEVWSTDRPLVTGLGRRGIAYRADRDQANALLVLDLATGRVLLDLGDWAPHWGGRGRWLLLSRPPDPGNLLRAELAVLDVDRLALYRLPDLPGPAFGCQVNGSYLVCPSSGTELVVRRYALEAR